MVVNDHVPGSVRFGIITAAGFGAGEFLMINCNVRTTATPSAVDFLIVNFRAYDMDGRALDGLPIPAVSVEMH